MKGSAYFVGGLGVNFQAKDDIILAPIRTGVGARLGANVGYLKYSEPPQLEPLLSARAFRPRGWGGRQAMVWPSFPVFCPPRERKHRICAYA